MAATVYVDESLARVEKRELQGFYNFQFFFTFGHKVKMTILQDYRLTEC